MPSKQNITKRACDGCKIRKIRCGGGHPCQACCNARIKCTYIRVQQPRGPQRLRSTTQYLIEQTQRETSRGENALDFETSAAQIKGSRIPTNILASPLYIYHVRMYPVWPIVDVEKVLAILQKDINGIDLETYALATAVAAATIAQLRLGQSSLPENTITADCFATESLKARRASGYRSSVNLNNVRTAFFLHVYYENQHSGGSESLLYLREALSLAQMMHLHREVSYRNVAPEEQQIRRRVLWLLFVTERGVCILHKLPVILKTNIATPDLDTNDEPQVLPAFLKLLNLFRLFEQAKMFDVIEDENPEIGCLPDKMGDLDKRFVETLQDRLQDGTALLDRISDVQKADLCVTRHWMRMILWKVSAKNSARLSSSSFPVVVAQELLNIVSQLPRTAIEAHGLGMELKLYEIANSLADAVLNLAMLPRAPTWDSESRPSSILARLHAILSTFRGGGNKELVEILYRKMAEAKSRSCPVIPSSIGSPPQSHLQNRHSIDGAETERALLGDSTFMQCIHTELDHAMPGLDWQPGQELSSALHPISSGSFRQETANQEHGRQASRPHFDDPDHPDVFSRTTLTSPHRCYPGESNDSGYALYDMAHFLPTQQDNTSHTSTAYPALSPSLPSTSMEMLIGDFISQIPDGHIPDNFLFDDFTNQSASNEFPFHDLTS